MDLSCSTAEERLRLESKGIFNVLIFRFQTHVFSKVYNYMKSYGFKFKFYKFQSILRLCLCPQRGWICEWGCVELDRCLADDAENEGSHEKPTKFDD